jgi:hypothetical protein
MSDYIYKIDENKSIENSVKLLDYPPTRFGPRLKHKRQRGFRARLNKLTCSITTHPYYTLIGPSVQLNKVGATVVGKNLTFIGQASPLIAPVGKTITGINRNFFSALSPSLLKPSVQILGLQGNFQFHPQDYGSVLFHYDPNDITGSSPGDPVLSLLDKSGNGWHLAQATTTKRPTLVVDGLNKLLEFDGVDDNLGRAHNVALEPNPMTLCMVLTINGPANFAQPISKMNGSAWTQGWGLSWYSADNTLRFMLDNPNNNNARETFPVSNKCILVVRYNDPNMEIWLNNIYGISDTLVGGYTSTPFNSLRLGSGNNDNYFWKGRIGEIVMWNQAINDTNIGNIFTALNNKWNIY